MIQQAVKTLAAIDKAIVAKHDEHFRRHLGASIIGRPCMRALWYSFRWAKLAKFEARMLRLFGRGHLEEPRFVEYLKNTGCKVWDVDEKGDQFRFSFCDGHAGGSLDGVAVGVPDLPEGTPCLTEFKTHNNKNFKQLVQKGVMESKFEHYVQMQLYMHGYDLPYALYMAINKDDDSLYLEIVERNKMRAKIYMDRAKDIVYAETPPNRINKSPGWWQCSWCDYKGICHKEDVAAVNCRTCANSTPIADGAWSCERHKMHTVDHTNYVTDGGAPCTGCDDHIFLPGMIGKAQLIGMADDRSWIKYKVKGKELINGRNHTTSKSLSEV